jgi:PadR family transcriptional regulator PadR
VTSVGTLSPLRARLRQDGLVDTFWRESRQGLTGPYYRITKQSEKALEFFAEQWDRFRDAVDLSSSEGA